MARSGTGFFLRGYEATAACYAVLGGLPSNNRGMDNVYDKVWDFDNIKSHVNFLYSQRPDLFLMFLVCPLWTLSVVEISMLQTLQFQSALTDKTHIESQ
jgi:hypothetical protein